MPSPGQRVHVRDPRSVRVARREFGQPGVDLVGEQLRGLPPNRPHVQHGQGSLCGAVQAGGGQDEQQGAGAGGGGGGEGGGGGGGQDGPPRQPRVSQARPVQVHQVNESTGSAGKKKNFNLAIYVSSWACSMKWEVIYLVYFLIE